MGEPLPSIPAKRYFTIGEVGDLCGVKPHVLRYWEQEFTQLRPVKRRGNRRYYQHHEVLMIRRIRDLLYDQGFTISGARNKLQELVQVERDKRRLDEPDIAAPAADDVDAVEHLADAADATSVEAFRSDAVRAELSLEQVRRELHEIRLLLSDPL
jgi:DNA-binding transcriptional MerR regulator